MAEWFVVVVWFVVVGWFVAVGWFVGTELMVGATLVGISVEDPDESEPQAEGTKAAAKTMARYRGVGYLERLAAFATIRDEIATEEQYAKYRPYWLLTLDAGERSNQAFIEWADAAIAQLDTLSAAEKLA